MRHVDPRILAGSSRAETLGLSDAAHTDRCVTCRSAADKLGLSAADIANALAAAHSRRRALLLACAVASFAAIVAVAAPLRAAALGFFGFFEPRTVAAVPLTLDEMRSLGRIGDLSAYASTRQLRASKAAVFDNVRAAAAAAGFAPRAPVNVPAGLRAISYVVNGPSEQLVTFEGRASAPAAAALPPDIAGSTLHVALGAAVVTTYMGAASAADEQRLRQALRRLPSSGAQNGRGPLLMRQPGSARAGEPSLVTQTANAQQQPPPSAARGARFIHFSYTGHITVVRNSGISISSAHRFGLPLIVAQMAAPRIATTGASIQRLESFMLGQPGVPPRVAAAFRALGDLSTTLPIPVPIDKAYSQPVIVDGVAGVGIGDDTGIGAAVIWQKNGMLYAVFAPRTAREVLAIANSLT